jgi:hypothetical protein
VGERTLQRWRNRNDEEGKEGLRTVGLATRRASGFRSTGMQGLIAARTAVITVVAAIDADMRHMARSMGKAIRNFAAVTRVGQPGIARQVLFPSISTKKAASSQRTER